MALKQKKSGRDKTTDAAEPQLPIGNGGSPCRESDIASATISGPSTIPINGTVQLTGTADEFILSPNCQLTTRPTPFTWSLFFTPPGGAEAPVSGGLSGASTLTPTFVASEF